MQARTPPAVQTGGTMSRDMITFKLEGAFKKPGCPLCRLHAELEARYLFGLLWENVNDPGIRARLRQSLGFCREHAWMLVATEQQSWGGGLGTGIIYEDLIKAITTRLDEIIAQGQELRGATPRGQLQAGWTRLTAWFARQWQILTSHVQQPPALPYPDLSPLVPQDECLLCTYQHASEATDLEWLVNNCTDPDFRAHYQQSDGLCLPHLRAALTLAGESEAALFLAQVAQEKLATLRRDLGEYLRKFSYQYKDEPKTPAELVSWRKAVAFLVGEENRLAPHEQ